MENVLIMGVLTWEEMGSGAGKPEGVGSFNPVPSIALLSFCVILPREVPSSAPLR